MNTYQRELLDKLITELTDNPDPSLHAAQMLAAELKGRDATIDFPTKTKKDAKKCKKVLTWVMSRCRNPSP